VALLGGALLQRGMRLRLEARLCFGLPLPG
jgi:hypothetical protein